MSVLSSPQPFPPGHLGTPPEPPEASIHSTSKLCPSSMQRFKCPSLVELSVLKSNRKLVDLRGACRRLKAIGAVYICLALVEINFSKRQQKTDLCRNLMGLKKTTEVPSGATTPLEGSGE
ncbi:hypothetical protein AOLI_G00056950 [Acnodon oligacanthus]